MPDLPDLDQILYSGQLASGKYTQEFEEKLRKYFGSQYVLVTNSFHTAISVAVRSCGFQHGDEIIASPMACLASTQPYATEGLKIIWADIDPKTGTLNPDSVKEKITSKTKGIIHNHFCGYPGYIDEINAIGHEYGIITIDDGIECFGTTYKGKKIGDCGTDVTVFSFNPVRILTTIDGGAVLFNEKNLYEKGLLIRDCGIDRKNFRDELGEIKPSCDIKIQGYSATLRNVNADMGIQQLLTSDERIKKQRKVAWGWEKLIDKDNVNRSLECSYGEPNYWVYGIFAPDKKECIEFFRKKGFYASGVHINNNIYSVFGKQETLPGVKEFYNSFVALPCGWWMEEI